MRYLAAACQTDLPCPTDRAGIARNAAAMRLVVERTVAGYAPFGDVRLLVFPEFAHAAPIHPTSAELLEHLALPVPNEHTEAYAAQAKALGVYVQTGTFLERDDRFPDVVFNTSCLIGPEGLLSRYRKVNPWIPWEVHASPFDLPDYPDDPFPVVETPLGRLGCAICYDWLFPEVLRQLTAQGAEILLRVSAYMDPWGATPPMDWWTVVNRARALENTAYVVAANQGASAARYPPFSWPGGSMVVDWDGRILAQADPGPGDKVVVAPIDLEGLRAERRRRVGHHTLAHLRPRAYPVYRGEGYPHAAGAPRTVAENEARIAARKRALGEG